MGRRFLAVAVALLLLAAAQVLHTLRAEPAPRTRDDLPFTSVEVGRRPQPVVDRVSGPGLLERAHGAIVEQWFVDGPRARQLFWFGARPAGPVRITLRFPSAQVEGVDPRGAVLRRGTSVLRYSAPVWVDSASVQRALPLTALDEQTLLVSLDDATLDGTSWPAVIDPWLGPVLDLDPIVMRPVDRLAAMASFGDHWLTLTPSGGLWAVFSDGGAAPVPVPGDGGLQPCTAQAIVGSRGEVGVLRCDAVDGTVRELLHVLADGGFVTAPAFTSVGQGQSGLAATDDGFAVVWDERLDGGDWALEGARIARGGALTLRQRLYVSTPPNANTRSLSTMIPLSDGQRVWVINVPADGGASYIAWDADGGVVEVPRPPNPFGGFASGDGVAWFIHLVPSPDGGSDPMVGPLPGPATIRLAPAAASYSGVASIPIGPGVSLFSYQEQGGTHRAVLVDRDGGTVPWPVALGTNSEFSFVAAGAHHAGVVAFTVASGEGAKVATLALDGGARSPLTAPVVSPNRELYPVTRGSGREALVTFLDDRTPGVTYGLTAAVVGPDGRLAAPVLAAPRDEQNSGFATEIAAVPDGWALAWGNVFTVFARRIFLDGGSGPTAHLVPAADPFAYVRSVGALGDTMLVGWQQVPSSQWVVQRVVDGGALGAPVTLPASTAALPAIGAFDTDYTVITRDGDALVQYRLDAVSGGLSAASPLFTLGVSSPSCAYGTCDERRCVVAVSGRGTEDAGQELFVLRADGGTQRSGLTRWLDSAGCLDPALGDEKVWLELPQPDAGIVMLSFDPDTLAPLGRVELPLSTAAYAVLDGGDLLFTPYRGTQIAVQRVIPGGLAQGRGCAADAECATGHCVDGVCCDSTCGGGMPFDCKACSTLAGAPGDGVCMNVVAGTLCRPSAMACDPEERCTGTSPACPVDVPFDVFACSADAGADAGGGGGGGSGGGGSGGGGGAPSDGGMDAANYRVGCGCGAGGEVLLGAVALLLGAARRRR